MKDSGTISMVPSVFFRTLTGRWHLASYGNSDGLGDAAMAFCVESGVSDSSNPASICSACVFVDCPATENQLAAFEVIFA
jgi:hypothetical protein